MNGQADVSSGINNEATTRRINENLKQDTDPF